MNSKDLGILATVLLINRECPLNTDFTVREIVTLGVSCSLAKSGKLAEIK